MASAQSVFRIILSLSLASILGGLASVALAQEDEFVVELESEEPPYFDFETRQMIARRNARLTYGPFIVSADEIRYSEDSGQAIAEGDVVFTRGDIRLVADSLDFRVAEQTAIIENFRVGNGRYYVQGSRLEGDPSNFRFEDVRFLPGEPGTFLFKATADEIAIVDRNEIEGKKLFFKVGLLPLLLIPNITQPIDAETNLFRADIDYSGNIGLSLGGAARIPLGNHTRVGANVALTTERGVLLGPAFEYKRNDENGFVLSEFTSGYIDDQGDEEQRGFDVLDRPIDSERYFAEWRHIQRWGEKTEVSAFGRWWSDSEVTRDFYEDSYDLMQEPDSYLQASYADDNWIATFFTRASPNTFQTVAERLPELRFDLLPKSFAKDFYQDGFVSLARVNAQNFGSETGLDTTDRIDSYYGVHYDTDLREGVTLGAQAGARAVHYFDALVSQGSGDPAANRVPQTGSATRAFGEIGLDLKLTAFRESDFKNKVWNINGLRHIIEPVIGYRYQPELADDFVINDAERHFVSSYLDPLDLSETRSVGSLTEAHTLRLELRNRLQTRHEDYGSRDLLRFDLALDYQIDADTALGEDDFSDLHLDLELRPAPWLSVDLYQRINLESGNAAEFNSRIGITDTGYWKLGFGNHYLNTPTRGELFRGAIHQYFAFGEYQLSENLKLYASTRYDQITNSFSEQRIGFMQRAIGAYGIKYELRLYDDNVGINRREDGFGISIGIDSFED